MTERESTRLYFDYVDPASYLLDRRLRDGLGAGEAPGLTYLPFERRPPPQALLRTDDPEWAEAWDRLAAEDDDLTRPWIVPWSRKAHELVLFARESGCFWEIHDAIFRAYFVEGLDIGRVDILVDLARRNGLGVMEAKAALDVDRFRPEVEAVRSEALAAGVEVTTTLVMEGRLFPGYPETEVLKAVLTSASRNDNSKPAGE
jgi:predicted DsbA family dithiol-disulfide isomerase